jgi:hypothetical protein
MKKVFLVATVLAFTTLLIVVVFNLFLKESSVLPPMFQSKEVKLKNRPTVYNLGVNFEDFNPSTSRAGDFVFSKDQAWENRVFLEFGYLAKNDQGKKILPHPTYFLPQGTKMMAVGSGKVVDLRFQPESNDYELMIQPLEAPAWRIAYDHLENVRFKKGETVQAGEVIGEISLGYGNDAGNFTMTEISVFLDGFRPEDIENYCLYLLLDDSVKEKYAQKILQFAKDWEEYTGNPQIYDEASWIFPGCRYEKLNEAETMN